MSAKRIFAAALALLLVATIPARAGNLPTAAASPFPPLAQLIGQKLMVAMSGTTPSKSLLGRIRRGEVGGVILFGANITTATELTALTGALRAAAAAGGQPPLLIATDQEGGSIKRISWVPPLKSPRKMCLDGQASKARTEGADTGAALASLGINVDLAPVADVPHSNSSFMYQQGRTFSFNAQMTATCAGAFAAGLADAGVLATMKHFPGLGYAKLNTDSFAVTIKESKKALASELLPYRNAIKALPIIMLSNATYAAYDPANGAGWSRAVSVTLLRDQLGFNGVTITDSLSGTAAAQGVSVKFLAARAAAAGTDMILVSDSETSTRQTFRALMMTTMAGNISKATLLASYTRILALKTGLK